MTMKNESLKLQISAVEDAAALIEIEWAHHVPGGPGKAASLYPRAVLVRFHNYVDKEQYSRSLLQRKRWGTESNL